MKKNSLWKSGEQIYRILEVKEDTVFVIDCVKRTMPKWMGKDTFSDCIECIEKELILSTGIEIPDEETMNTEDRRFIREHFTLIAPILPFVSDEKKRAYIINEISIEKNISKQTIRNYLCLYLVYQNEAVFCPKQKEEKELTEDEKNMRWGLNKFFYNHNKNSLTTAYTLLLQAKYCDESGKVLPEHPSINQFRYFEKKYRKRQNYYISRNGLKDYQKNYRPLLGDGIQEFASHVGVGMLDATVCDIYLEALEFLIASVLFKNPREVPKQTEQTETEHPEHVVENSTAAVETTKEEKAEPDQPKMTRLASEYPKLFKVNKELEDQNGAIQQKQKQLSAKKKELSEVKGWFKGRKKKELQNEIDELKSQIRDMKDYLPKIVQKIGYRSVQEFLKDFKVSQTEYSQYRTAIEKWKKETGKEPVAHGIRAKLAEKKQEIQNEQKNKQHIRSQNKDRGAR